MVPASSTIPSVDASLTTEASSVVDKIAIYRSLLLIRRFEEKAGQLFGMGLVRGYCHLSIGQEAIAVGMRLAATPGDQFISSHRNHAHLLAAGADPRALMAELAGRSGGVSRGKGGSMHMFAPELAFYGGQGIVGAQISLGTGMAFANFYRGDGRVCAIFFGDGAADQGQAAESFCMAARWRLPAVYVIENNSGSATPSLAGRGAAFGIPGETVDGACVEAARAAGAAAMARARSGGGPTLIEMRTEPFRGHAVGAVENGRRRDDVGAAPDPLERQREKILRAGLASVAELKQIDLRVRAEVAEAADHAAKSPEPDVYELETDVLI